MTNFPLLKILNDEDFGFENTFSKSQAKIRKAVRGIIFDENDKIAILSLRKGLYFMVPGGGVEYGETEEEAVKRELKEECGIEIKELKVLGYTQENRGKKTMEDIGEANCGVNLSYGFIGRISGKKGEPQLQPDEIEEQTETQRMNIDEAIDLFENTPINNKIGHFVRKRDLILLQEAKKYIQNNKFLNS